MKYWDMNLRSSHGSCKRRVGITIEDYTIKMLRCQHLLNARNHLCSLHSMTPRAYSKIVIRCGNTQLVKKHLGHIGIIMLPCVEYSLLNLPFKTIFDCTRNGRRLDNLGACANYSQ